MHRTAKRLRRLAPLVVAVVALALAPAVGYAAGTRPFAVTITHVGCVDPCDAEGLEAALEGHPDFYAKVFINGVEHRTPTIDNNSGIDPYWVLAAEIPDNVAEVPVTIQIWDEDDTSGDDLGDDSAHDGDNNLDFTVSYVDGKWRDAGGDSVHWPQSCASGDGGDNDEPAVKVCFSVSTLSASGDADGDGLLDDWERLGYNDDGDNAIDVDLPAFGAHADHKDIFIELDSSGRTPTHAGIEAIRKAFAAAPENAGAKAGDRAAPNGGRGVSAPPNPDHRSGIDVHFDTGGLIDITAREDAPTGTCSDGVDNGSDGLIDGNDPTCIRPDVDYLDSSTENMGPPTCTVGGADDDLDGLDDAHDPGCLAGENLGGGNVLATPSNACGTDANFYDIKKANFNPNRRLIFHYGLFAVRPAGCPNPSGGQGELGGNDLVVFNRDTGAIMHELGHNLNLDHGGFEPTNCKPNYVSVMNYDIPKGIPRVGGGVILDFSPPRIDLNRANRGIAPLPRLVENNLTEPTVLDPGDGANRFVFTNTAGRKVTNNLNTSPDWDGDGDPPYETAPPTNLDTVGPNGLPAPCANTSTNETLDGSDDWSYVSLPFRQFGNAEDLAVNPEDEPLPTTEQLLAMYDELNTADVAVTVSDNPDPVAAGADVVYTASVTNHGPNPATSVTLVDSLPAQVAFVGADPACHLAGGTITCGLGDLVVGATRTVTITAHVPADLVYTAGGPVTLVNRSTVDNLAGPDPQPGNDNAATNTTVVAVADLAVTGFDSLTPPAQLLVGETVDVTLRATAANDGPSSPVDATLLTAATADPGASVTPASATRTLTALAVGTPQSADTTFTLGCARPGSHTFRFTASVTPARAGDTDPAPANNHRPAQFTLDCVVPVALNIMPGGNPNSINIPTDTVPTAVLTTNAGEYGLPLAFDATAIQPLTVHFGPRRVVYAGTGGSTEVHGTGHVEDAFERTTTPVERVKDGDPDMLLHFAAATSGLVPTDTEACVVGSYTDRATGETYRFLGCDTMRILP
jgi:uncharacterized repeat protein (TIGR01451 family)